MKPKQRAKTIDLSTLPKGTPLYQSWSRIKYRLYEKAVQSPETHIEMFEDFFKQLGLSEPRLLREDFCGTFALCAEWIKRHPKNFAMGLDLDPEPLEYGLAHHAKRLTPAQRKRLLVLKQNVQNKTSPRCDLIAACNFSFNIFKTRAEMLKYFKACHASLKTNGVLLLEAAGGPGMIADIRESKGIFEGKKRLATYTWDQASFDPIRAESHCKIHFRLSNGTRLRNAFEYDWRMWSIPELRELMLEAGFRETRVFWETEHQGKGTGEHVLMESGDNAYAWVAYPVGIA
jgi:SAM-dependent methyltransferase